MENQLRRARPGKLGPGPELGRAGRAACVHCCGKHANLPECGERGSVFVLRWTRPGWASLATDPPLPAGLCQFAPMAAPLVPAVRHRPSDPDSALPLVAAPPCPLSHPEPQPPAHAPTLPAPCTGSGDRCCPGSLQRTLFPARQPRPLPQPPCSHVARNLSCALGSLTTSCNTDPEGRAWEEPVNLRVCAR